MATFLERQAAAQPETLRTRVRITLYRVCLTKLKLTGSTAAIKAERSFARNVIGAIESHTERMMYMLAANIVDLADLNNDAQLESVLTSNWQYLAGSVDAV